MIDLERFTNDIEQLKGVANNPKIHTEYNLNPLINRLQAVRDELLHDQTIAQLEILANQMESNPDRVAAIPTTLVLPVAKALKQQIRNMRGE